MHNLKSLEANEYGMLEGLRSSQIRNLVEMAKNRTPMSNYVIAITVEQDEGFIAPSPAHLSHWQGLTISSFEVESVELTSLSKDYLNTSLWLDLVWDTRKTYESIVFDKEYRTTNSPWLMQDGMNSILAASVNVRSAELFLINDKPWYEDYTERRLVNLIRSKTKELVSFYEASAKIKIDRRVKSFDELFEINLKRIATNVIIGSIRKPKMVIPRYMD